MTTYIVDADHSTIGFTVRHAGIGKTRGKFDTFESTITIPSLDSLDGAATTAIISVGSINTGNTGRDDHLRSAEFFDAENFPTITFTSTALAGTPENFTLTGDLTIHGVTKPVELSVEFLGQATDPFGNDRIAFEASTTISRKEFGLTWNAALEAGGVLVGDKIAITLDIEAIKQA